MKEKGIKTPILIFILGFALGHFASNYIPTDFHKTDMGGAKTIRIRNFTNNVYEDMNGDWEDDRLESEYVYCEFLDGDNGYMPVVKKEDIPEGVGSANDGSGAGCDVPKVSISIYNQDTYEQVASAGPFDIRGSASSKLKPVVFGGEMLFTLDSLDPGAHSSKMLIFKMDGEKLIPVCTKGKKVSETLDCAFFSDAGGPYLKDLDGNGVPEVIEEAHTYSENDADEIVLTGVFVYRDGEFVDTEGEEYEKYLELYKRDSLYSEVISKYDWQKE